jgi:hypothetical protein
MAKKLRLFGTPGVPGPYQDLAATKIGAQEAEQRAIKDAFARAAAGDEAPVEEKEVLTFGEWFNGRFWNEWVVGRKNKPTEVRSKEIIYRCHLAPRFADVPLDEITVGEVAKLRAELVASELSEKRINNILAVLSKPLNYAADCELIAKAPRIGMFKVERPEIEAWDFARTRVSWLRRRPRARTGTPACAWPARLGYAWAGSRRCAGAKTST